MAQPFRPYALSIAGFDPSAGAGLLADVKTFESHGVYGLGVCTALTLQNDVSFERVNWVPAVEIREQIRVLFARFKVDFIKIGLVESLPQLLELVGWLKGQNPKLQLVWDPVLKASAGYEFHRQTDRQLMQALCAEMALVTPNKPEMLRMWPGEESAEMAAQAVSAFCPVLLKGGHDTGELSTDVLYARGKWDSFAVTRLPHGEKHGSGCVLSAAVLANLAKGETLVEACEAAKDYTTEFLASNDTLLGYHSKS
ncbi:bifunctional hydroxymethylpyrimidine kinase/phosphomethylpyrimidine kinase [Hymenobacter convexus]|uniref:bifunctional hydroxymethylpyrimidine kinase/phosphomethylpyrimidine kinase n=1 Tax=Hymenobacter sp. CA1UV-4 TaxID=3063782 RepID=UPI0027138174|nr:hydroxymethylpyrimidine/phosphomethylpyrimidine kinase [Hymenobacter sp. CA1UV-4]MDO7850197.1 hydroxymethylpyrimidine/phosphomethylpyrimidine kinase [Hymenobacter sp. CA1UV-4]